MSDYATLLRRDRRLSILRVLNGASGFVSNDSILTRMVNIRGVTSTRDQVKGDVLWLGEQGYVTVENVEGLLIATLTRRGAEVAEGVATHPEITRPSPKD